MLEGEPIIAREIAPHYLLVDEYQDLNRCDQAIIYALAEAGSKVFVAGDDDQSIYVKLRHAHPEGIRRFPERFAPCEPSKPIKLCKRCPRKIIDAVNKLIKNDRDREDKTLIPRPDAPEGSVFVLNFRGPRREAVGIANICQGLHSHHRYKWSEILILLSRGRLGNLIAEELDNSEIPFVNVEKKNPLDNDAVRLSYSELRLLSNEYDALALRTWFDLQTGIGGSAVEALRELCSENSVALIEGAKGLALGKYGLPRFGNGIVSAWQRLAERLEKLKGVQEDLLTLVELLFGANYDSNPAMEKMYIFLTRLIQEKTVKNVSSMITMLQTTEFEIEHADEDLQDAVRLMTMYKAKGLEAPVVIVPGLENDLMPGSEDVETINERRRLLYVSITRSKEALILTHCTYRSGPGAYMGTGGGETQKKRSDFFKEMGFNRSLPADDTNTSYFRDKGEWL
jgi:DNA helicase-2/ATP-dependent DNA helicase PcrA